MGIASMIKNHVAYNQMDGEDLGIEVPDVAPLLLLHTPTLPTDTA
jgi:hypothetical protein